MEILIVTRKTRSIQRLAQIGASLSDQASKANTATYIA